MIQRIQSIYLLMVATLNGLLFIFPLNEIISNNHILSISVMGVFEITGEQSVLIADLYPLLVINLVAILLAFVSIFLFKNRKMQMRLTVYNSIVNLSILTLALFYTYQIATIHNISLGFSVGLIFPLISAFFSYLAFRAIQKDDNLIKSIDRIR